MINNQKVVAIITARGGSKLIPRKNIKPFLGQPIIKYSIEAAIRSNLFSEVMVSTDDKEIAEISIKYGAKVPFFRSAKNSDDHTSTADVIVEVLLEYKERGKEFDYAFCIYPTAPFVTVAKLKEALQLLENSGADSVLPVTCFNYPIQRGLKIEKDGRLKMIWPENMNASSQDLIPVYHDCGQFYCLKVTNFLSQKKLFAENTRPIIVSELEVQDIDNEEDWKMAEIKYQVMNKKIKTLI
jgi:N-acylneuraminate cytidylyltransferase